MASNASAKAKFKDKLSFRNKSDCQPPARERLRKSRSFSYFINKFKPSVSVK